MIRGPVPYGLYLYHHASCVVGWYHIYLKISYVLVYHLFHCNYFISFFLSILSNFYFLHILFWTVFLHMLSLVLLIILILYVTLRLVICACFDQSSASCFIDLFYSFSTCQKCNVTCKFLVWIKFDSLNGVWFYFGQDDGLLKSNMRVCKSISFLFPNGITVNAFYLLHPATYIFLSIAYIAFTYVLPTAFWVLV